MKQAMKKSKPLPTLLPRATALGVLAAFGLGGCQLAGEPGKTPTIPEVMKQQPVPKEPPKEPVVQEGRNLTEKEYFPPTGPLLGSVGKSGGAGAPAAKEGKYTLNFDDADLAEVAKVILGDTLKLNYVINPKVTGKVSLQTAKPLADDEMIPTLEMLLHMNGAVLIKSGSLYKIEPEASATIDAPGIRAGLSGLEPGYQLRVVPVRYVNVAELQKAIEPLMPPKSVVRADEARNMLLLAGTAEELESVMETIRLFDVDYMRGMSTAIFPVKNVDAPTLSEELEKLLGTGSKGPLAGMIRLFPIERLNAIMAVSPQAGYLEDVESWIARLDRYNTNRSSNLHVYRVQNVDAADLANTIGQIFGQGGRSGSRGASVAPGMTGSSVSGGSGSFGGDTNSASSGSSSDFGDDGGSSSGGFGGGGGGFGSSSSSSGLGGSSTGGSSGFGGSSTGTASGRSGSGSASGRSGGGGFGGSFGSSSSGGRGGRSRGATATDLGNNTRIIADPNNNALIIMAKPADYKEIEAVIKELDILPLQVLIDATIVEVSLTDNLKYGLKWYFDHGGAGGYALNPPGVQRTTTGTGTGTGTGSSTTTGIPGGASLSGALAAAGSAASGGFTYALVSHAQDLRIELDALATLNKVNFLSTPSLMVLNNQEAQINVGDRVPTPTSSAANLLGGTTSTTGLGSTITSGIQYQESGVSLRVKPRVNAGGLVIMDVAQENSTPTQVTVGNVQTFQFAQRKIRSQVAVPSGDTLALGGLIQDKRADPSISGLPILSRLPFIGWLFGQKNIDVSRTELVMLLTPRVITSRPDITRITNEFRNRMTTFSSQHAPVSVETLPPAPAAPPKP
jgi:general secretion pathway protein D